MLGAHFHAHRMGALPVPSDDIQRQLRRFIEATGLPYDAAIATRDPLLEHCMFLPEAGLLVTATRAQAPLLGANCVDLARCTDLDVLLLRFGPRPHQPIQTVGITACLISHVDNVQLVSREGYRAIIPPGGGLLLRHVLEHLPDYQVGH